MTVSVCVPVYRAHDQPNVATLAASVPGALDGLDGELVVALNGIDAEHAGVPSEAVVVDLGINRGVAPGWNAAARAARGEILVFANDDVLLGKGALAVIANALDEHPDAGVVGPVGANWDLSGPPREIESVDPHDAPVGELHRCESVAGFLLACRREVFERIGGFDEHYAPCICEELDFCLAVRASGLNCYAIGGVIHEHEYSISKARPWTRLRHNGRTEMLWRIHRRNLRHFRRKWAGRA
ncbi:MAG TPA: glycosyltransferase family 2 protein [Solirubrobacteraceae bacterium]|nr:glycosyltransferase family 2 protein [Solirubrobacteraceae bacterium]